MRFVPGGAAVIVAAAVSASALSACTGDAVAIVTETPSPTAVASTTTTRTASPTPTPSTSDTSLTDDEVLALMPDGASREDYLGAMLTTQFFLGQFGPMFRTGDARVWRALSADACEYCRSAAADAERIAVDGWLVSGFDVVANLADMEGGLTSDGAAIIVVADVDDGSTRGGDDGATSVVAGGEFEFGFVLEFHGGLWRVTAVAVEQAPA